MLDGCTHQFRVVVGHVAKVGHTRTHTYRFHCGTHLGSITFHHHRLVVISINAIFFARCKLVQRLGIDAQYLGIAEGRLGFVNNVSARGVGIFIVHKLFKANARQGAVFFKALFAIVQVAIVENLLVAIPFFAGA